MIYVKQSLDFVKTMIYDVRMKTEELERELKENENFYSPEGIAITEKEKREYEKELEILQDVRERLEKGSSELYQLSKEA